MQVFYSLDKFFQKIILRKIIHYKLYYNLSQITTGKMSFERLFYNGGHLSQGEVAY